MKNKEKEEKSSNIIGNIIEEQSNSIQPKCDELVKNKKKIEKPLKSQKSITKDKWYYHQNKEMIKKKAREKYWKRMKNRQYRFNYLAKQREYNRRRKRGKLKTMEKYNLKYLYDPFHSSLAPLLIIYEREAIS